MLKYLFLLPPGLSLQVEDLGCQVAVEGLLDQRGGDLLDGVRATLVVRLPELGVRLEPIVQGLHADAEVVGDLVLLQHAAELLDELQILLGWLPRRSGHSGHIPAGRLAGLLPSYKHEKSLTREADAESSCERTCAEFVDAFRTSVVMRAQRRDVAFIDLSKRTLGPNVVWLRRVRTARHAAQERLPDPSCVRRLHIRL